jgi:hypothetical protein
VLAEENDRIGEEPSDSFEHGRIHPDGALAEDPVAEILDHDRVVSAGRRQRRFVLPDHPLVTDLHVGGRPIPPELDDEVAGRVLEPAIPWVLPDEVEVHEVDVARRHEPDDVLVLDAGENFRGGPDRLRGDH